MLLIGKSSINAVLKFLGAVAVPALENPLFRRTQVVNMKMVIKPLRNSQEMPSTQNLIVLEIFSTAPNSWFFFYKK